MTVEELIEKLTKACQQSNVLASDDLQPLFGEITDVDPGDEVTTPTIIKVEF